MEALGIYLDGDELRLAHLKKSKNSIELISCEKILMHSAYEGGSPGEKNADNDFSEVFSGTEDENPEVVEGATSEELDINLLFNILAKYPQKNLNIGVNLLESEVTFVTVANHKKGNRKRVKDRIRDELEKITPEIADEDFDCIKNSQNEYTAFYLNKDKTLLDKVLAVKNAVKSRVAVTLVDVNEVSLVNLYMNLVENNERCDALVYIGRSFSRILVFKNKRLMRLSQLINEGYKSEHVIRNVYAKILYEQDSIEADEIGHIYVTGDGDLDKLKTFFEDRFPECSIRRFPFEKVISESTLKTVQNPDSFSIPISMAWKILNKKNAGMVDTNFLPPKIKKQQGAFRLAWHGFFTMALLFLVTLFFVYQWHKFAGRKEAAGFSIALAEMALSSEREIAARINVMDEEAKKYLYAVSLTDSLWEAGTMHSDALLYISKKIGELNSIWLNDFILQENGFSTSGTSLYKQRIHRLADSTGSAVIESMAEQEIRGRTLYQFDLRGDPWNFIFPNHIIVCDSDSLTDKNILINKLP